MWAKKKACIWLITAVLLSPAARAVGIDLHYMWDDRCFECHGHAAEFARRTLSISNGRLQGRHHVDDLRRFMRYHYLADNEVDAVYRMLLAQASSQARFKDECSRCHNTAANFVRHSLEFHNGELYGRKSGQPVRGFLNYHVELDPYGVAFFDKLLTRVASEVYRP